MAVGKSRVNGLTSPPHPMQIASYILFLFFVVTFYSLFVLYPGLGGRIAAGLIFGLGAVATLICAGLATATNPADKNIYVANPRSARDLMPGHLYCYRCERHVLDTSKHCTICHKCVDVFDHHCIWLNNCVGRHNYMAFLALLLSAATMLVVQVAIGIYILVDYASDKAALDLYVRNSLYSGLSGTAYFAVTIIITILCLTAFGLVGQLLSFHCYLIFHDQTTYDYIMGRIAMVRQREMNAAAESSGGPALPAPVIQKGKGSAFTYAMADFRARRKLKGIVGGDGGTTASSQAAAGTTIATEHGATAPAVGGSGIDHHADADGGASPTAPSTAQPAFASLEEGYDVVGRSGSARGLAPAGGDRGERVRRMSSKQVVANGAAPGGARAPAVSIELAAMPGSHPGVGSPHSSGVGSGSGVSGINSDSNNGSSSDYAEGHSHHSGAGHDRHNDRLRHNEYSGSQASASHVELEPGHHHQHHMHNSHGGQHQHGLTSSSRPVSSPARDGVHSTGVTSASGGSSRSGSVAVSVSGVRAVMPQQQQHASGVVVGLMRGGGDGDGYGDDEEGGKEDGDDTDQDVTVVSAVDAASGDGDDSYVLQRHDNEGDDERQTTRPVLTSGTHSPSAAVAGGVFGGVASHRSASAMGRERKEATAASQLTIDSADDADADGASRSVGGIGPGTLESPEGERKGVDTDTAYPQRHVAASYRRVADVDAAGPLGVEAGQASRYGGVGSPTGPRSEHKSDLTTASSPGRSFLDIDRHDATAAGRAASNAVGFPSTAAAPASLAAGGVPSPSAASAASAERSHPARGTRIRPAPAPTSAASPGEKQTDGDGGGASSRSSGSILV